MSSNTSIKRGIKHLIFIIFFLIICIHIQTSLLAPSSYGILHADIASIVVIYIALRHHWFGAIIPIILGISILQSTSAAHTNFFTIYYFFVLIAANCLSRIITLNKNSEILFTILMLYLFKFILFYIALFNNNAVTLFGILSFSWQEILITSILILPIYKFLFNIDTYFKEY